MKEQLSATRWCWHPQYGICVMGLLVFVGAMMGFRPWRSMADAPRYRDTKIDQTMDSAMYDAPQYRDTMIDQTINPEMYLESPDAEISPDGRFITFDAMADKSATVPFRGSELCRYDRESGTITARIPNASLAGFTDTGKFLVFVTNANGLIMLRDAASGQEEAVNVATDGTKANARCFGLHISADGRYVMFNTPASNLIAGDSASSSDFFVRDTVAKTTEYVSVTPLEQLGDERRNEAKFDGHVVSYRSPLAIDNVEISADARVIAFTSSATQLVANDTNGVEDVFVHDRTTGTNAHISKSSDGAPGNGASRCLDMTPDGNYILFSSAATNLVPKAKRPKSQLYMADRVKNIVMPVQ